MRNTAGPVLRWGSAIDGSTAVLGQILWVAMLLRHAEHAILCMHMPVQCQAPGFGCCYSQMYKAGVCPFINAEVGLLSVTARSHASLF